MLRDCGQQPFQAVGAIGLVLIPDPFSIRVTRWILADGAEPAFGGALEVSCEEMWSDGHGASLLLSSVFVESTSRLERTSNDHTRVRRTDTSRGEGKGWLLDCSVIHTRARPGRVLRWARNMFTAEVERRVKAIQQKLDRLDEAFLYAQAIDLTSYERQRDKLRDELTLAQIDRHAGELEELDVEGILAFAERVPSASDLWV